MLTELVPMLENHTSLSFIQTPQYFTKDVEDRLAVFSSIQQHILINMYVEACMSMIPHL